MSEDTSRMTETERKHYEKTKKRVKFSFVAAMQKGRAGSTSKPNNKPKYRKARFNEKD
jgi:hypothetical protein